MSAAEVEAHERQIAEGARWQALQALSDAEKARLRADRLAAEAVAQARNVGISWERIGAALGSTGEGARRRYLGRHSTPR